MRPGIILWFVIEENIESFRSIVSTVKIPLLTVPSVPYHSVRSPVNPNYAWEGCFFPDKESSNEAPFYTISPGSLIIPVMKSWRKA